MAQPIDAHRSSPSKVSRTQTSPQPHHSKGEVSNLSSNSSPILRNNDHHGNHHIKKSVFMRVKEKARKLKKSISGRKHRDAHDSRSPYATPPGSARHVNDDKDRPEIFSSPSYVPTVEPETEKHKNTSNVDRGSTDSTESKLSNLTISGDRDANKPVQPQDKGVSVKEYLMHKLEPGEDERALSQAITQTLSPRRDKMKEAMNTLLGTEEPSQSTNNNNNKTSNSELDGSNSNGNTGGGSSIESSNVKVGSVAESSNTNVCSTSLSGSGQNQNLGPSSTGGCSNLKPNSGSNHLDSNQSLVSDPSTNVHVDTSANATQAPTSSSSREGTKG